MRTPTLRLSARRRGSGRAAPSTGLTRLVVAELRYGYRPWLAVWAVATAAAACTQVAMALVTLGQAGDDRADASGLSPAEAYGTIGGTVLALTLPTAVIAISISATLCVRLSSPKVARWQLAGVTPRQAGRVVRAQLVIVCTLGAAAGAALAYAAWPWIGDLAVAAELPDSAALRGVPPPAAAAWTVAIQGAVGLAAGGAAARRTRLVEPIDVLRQVEGDERKGGPLRLVVAGALVAALAAGSVAIARQDAALDYERAMALATIFVPFGMATIAAVVALGPWIYGAVMRAWTAIVPDRRSVSWFLARNTARSHLAYSSGVITPLYVAASAVGVTYEWIAVCRAVATAAGLEFRGTGTPLAQMVLFFGGAVLIAAVSTAGVIFAAARGKERDTALLTVSGATRGPILRTAVLESAIYAATTLILALLTVAGARAAFTVALAAGPLPGMTLSAPSAAIYVVCAAGLMFILAATLIPVQRSLRADVMDALRTE